MKSFRKKIELKFPHPKTIFLIEGGSSLGGVQMEVLNYSAQELIDSIEDCLKKPDHWKVICSSSQAYALESVMLDSLFLIAEREKFLWKYDDILNKL